MKDIIILSVKEYSDIYFSEDIEIVEKIEFEKCKCVKILLSGAKNFFLVLRVSDESLTKMSKKLFGIVNEDMKIDLIKEMLNIIAGNIQTKLNKGYELSLPVLCDKCKVKNGLFFKNSILEIAVSIQKQ
ncbi:chemotaxis protein CheX [Hydrogenimonas thermophila]|uniref:chemotaxis protein CheX n=1 Tax=Hydrogenimonas thermophila TaxID=223786 RepID=UPI00293743DC|nr:chemotaxis protein CheX [Hydrogenimonas thermophila]WOE69406.1 chemotaxis protein CheX [Hydrogenimonas thermophila]WOE71915.1 chemotaxis protein CheX [Hydrogenimonas thermophila]